MAVSTRGARGALVEPVIRATAEVVAPPSQVGPLTATVLTTTQLSGSLLIGSTSIMESTSSGTVLRSVSVASLDGGALSGSTSTSTSSAARTAAGATGSTGDRAIIQVRDAQTGRTVLVPSPEGGDGRVSLIVSFD
ncbi:MAG: hypothetical protein ACOYLV_04205 [Rubrivivax sp.]